jgi:large subunit ribosomal protein L6
MSRIGKLPIILPEKVEATIDGHNVKIKWPLWELNFAYFADKVEVVKKEDSLVVRLLDEEAKAFWWTTRAILNNMVIGVSKGYEKSLEINWVGYKFEVIWDKIILSIWYSHKVEIKVPAWIKAQLDNKEKNILHISWIDKQFIWEFTAKIVAKKKPEPYKWKWIKYVWEHIRRKAGKTGSK